MAASDRFEPAGFHIESFRSEQEAKRYECYLCKKIANDPVQIQTGTKSVELACTSCYRQVFR